MSNNKGRSPSSSQSHTTCRAKPSIGPKDENSILLVFAKGDNQGLIPPSNIHKNIFILPIQAGDDVVHRITSTLEHVHAQKLVIIDNERKDDSTLTTKIQASLTGQYKEQIATWGLETIELATSASSTAGAMLRQNLEALSGARVTTTTKTSPSSKCPAALELLSRTWVAMLLPSDQPWRIEA
jgi:hypothetical protein